MISIFKNKQLNILKDKYKTNNKINKIIKKTKNISEVYIKNNLIIFLIILISIYNYNKTYELIKLPCIIVNKLFFKLENINEYLGNI